MSAFRDGVLDGAARGQGQAEPDQRAGAHQVRCRCSGAPLGGGHSTRLETDVPDQRSGTGQAGTARRVLGEDVGGEVLEPLVAFGWPPAHQIGDANLFEGVDGGAHLVPWLRE